MWLCFDGLPAGLKVRAPLSTEKLSYGVIPEGDTRYSYLDTTDKESGWSVGFAFNQPPENQNLYGPAESGDVVIVIENAASLVNDPRKVFVDGSLPQINIGIIRESEAGLLRPSPWETLQRDRHGRIVYWP